MKKLPILAVSRDGEWLPHPSAARRLRSAVAAHQCTRAARERACGHECDHAMTKDPELQAYFAEAASWDRDRVAMQRRSARDGVVGRRRRLGGIPRPGRSCS